MNRPVRTLVLLALSSSALAGCASMAPEHTRPPAASAPAFDPEYRPDGEVVASQLSYRDWFTDPRLIVIKSSENGPQRYADFTLNVRGDSPQKNPNDDVQADTTNPVAPRS